MDESGEQSKNSKPWLYKKGQSGNPSGRPKGSKSLKTYAKELLEKMTDEEREEFLHGLPKDTIWEMAEGKAVSKLQGDSDAPLVIKIINYGNSNPQELPAQSVSDSITPIVPEV